MNALESFGLAALVFAAGVYGGWQLRDERADEEATRQAAQVAARQEQLRREGDATVQQLRDELAAAGTKNLDLQERLHLYASARPLVVASGGCGRAAAGPARAVAATAGAGAAAGGLVDGAPAAADDDAVAPHPVDDAAGPGLTLGAVSLWNSALAGADVPAGACRAADPADPACTAGAGITVEDAWRNHALNAASCAADRARLKRLIDFLIHRQRAASGAMP